MRSGYPVQTQKAFSTPIIRGDKMTLNGTVNKTFISLLLLFGCAYLTYNETNFSLLIGGAIVGFIVALITVFKKSWAPITVPIYAIAEGFVLGGISFLYSAQYEGIVSNAIFLTLGILISLLMLYKSGYVKATENFKLGVFAATGGIALVYLANFIMGFFGSSIGVLNPMNSSLLSIGFSLFVVVIAALNLVLDFDFIEKGVENGAPKYMEWFGAFGLLVTLIWLYLEILRLLAKLNNRR